MGWVELGCVGVMGIGEGGGRGGYNFCFVSFCHFDFLISCKKNAKFSFYIFNLIKSRNWLLLVN